MVYNADEPTAGEAGVIKQRLSSLILLDTCESPTKDYEWDSVGHLVRIYSRGSVVWDVDDPDAGNAGVRSANERLKGKACQEELVFLEFDSVGHLALVEVEGAVVWNADEPDAGQAGVAVELAEPTISADGTLITFTTWLFDFDSVGHMVAIQQQGITECVCEGAEVPAATTTTTSTTTTQAPTTTTTQQATTTTTTSTSTTQAVLVCCCPDDRVEDVLTYTITDEQAIPNCSLHGVSGTLNYIGKTATSPTTPGLHDTWYSGEKTFSGLGDICDKYRIYFRCLNEDSGPDSCNWELDFDIYDATVPEWKLDSAINLVSDSCDPFDVVHCCAVQHIRSCCDAFTDLQIEVTE